MTTEQDPASGDDLLRSYMNKLPQAAEDDPDDLPFESASGDTQDAPGDTQASFLDDARTMHLPDAQPLPDAPPALPPPRPPSAVAVPSGGQGDDDPADLHGLVRAVAMQGGALTNAAGRSINDVLGPGAQLRPSDFGLIKAPGAGVLRWELPDGEYVEHIDCVILSYRPKRAFWMSNQLGTSPDCSSEDSITGFPAEPDDAVKYQFGGACHDCRMSKFNTARGPQGEARGGQACKQVTQLVILRADQRLPNRLRLAPTSYESVRRYVLTEWDASRDFWGVVTRLTLKGAQSERGEEYGIVSLKRMAQLPAEITEHIGQFRQSFEAV